MTTYAEYRDALDRRDYDTVNAMLAATPADVVQAWLARRQRDAAEAARERGDLGAYLNHHAEPERVHALARVSDDLDHRTYWEQVAAQWVHDDQPSVNGDLWRRLLTAGRPCREAMMTEAEHAALRQRSPAFPVFRGFSPPGTPDGLSWTTDRECAVWFARWEGRGHREDRRGACVVSGRVRRDDVIAYFSERDESEVLVLPEDVMHRHVEAV